jgi:hypothetical protein
MSDDEFPSPTSEEIQGDSFHRDDPTITGVLVDMNVGTLYETDRDEALLETGDGNWFTFGPAYTREAGEAMVEVMDDE